VCASPRQGYSNHRDKWHVPEAKKAKEEKYSARNGDVRKWCKEDGSRLIVQQRLASADVGSTSYPLTPISIVAATSIEVMVGTVVAAAALASE
jgi:hypothetical protein